MAASRETWDSVEIPHTKTFYYCGKRYTPEQDRTIYLHLPEDFGNVPARNIWAFKEALDRFNFDYMARVNASCYVRKQQLLDAVQSLPEKNVFRGVSTGEFMWGGAQFIFSRDVIERMVEKPELWNQTLMEDMSLSKLAKDLGIPWDTNGSGCSINRQPPGWLCIYYENGGQGGLEFSDFADMKRLPGQYFLRVKQDLKRHEDVEIMHALHKAGV